MRRFMLVERATCPGCGSAFDPLRARAVRVLDGKVRAFCSNVCRDRGIRRTLEPDNEPPPKKSHFSTVVALAVMATLGLGLGIRGFRPVAPPVAVAAIAVPVHAPAPSLPEAMKLLGKGELEADLWVHPLAQPRRLPERPSRRFGAARDGMRPDECAGGHCGVDIGLLKGEVVMAAHDGVVERVVRDPDEGGRRGNEGRFIRITHKAGTIITSYMHLDGIRADLRAGVPVKAGEAIGTVGDTGVQHSGPHLHFAISVRASSEGDELFIDPEPMLYLWPMKPHAPSSLHAMESAAPPLRQKTAQADTTKGM